MKRSEAISFLADLFPDHLTVKGCHGNNYQVATYILDKLIEKGLQPPTVYIASTVKNRYGREYMIPKRIEGWEDEE
jgi:hypothetical protein